MSKAVMLSIRPKWCEKIASGEKTIEVRKTRPKLDTPFKCYIYCTLQGCNEFFRVDLGRDVAKWNRGKWADRKGNVIGEFTCDQIIDAWWDYVPDAITREVTGSNLEALDGTGMTDEELFSYVGDSMRGHCYGWHISDLRIYDAPKELSEFKTLCRVDAGCCACLHYDYAKMDCGEKVISRPPQSWCYVEDVQAK